MAVGADSLRRELAAICGPSFVRPAGPGDHVADARAQWVVAPGSTAGVAATLRVAARHGLVVVARGAGTKLDWGARPERVDLLLDTSRLAGVRRHARGEQVAELGVGTPFRAVGPLLSGTGQRLALDPPSVDSTVGGAVSAGETGPLRHRFGGPAEQVLGATYVRADGAVAHAAGPAGRASADFDLARLLCGADGALGVLVSATFRLQPDPAARCWIHRSVSTPLQVHDLVGQVLSEYLAPSAIELDLPNAAPVPRPRRPGGRGRGCLGVLIEGSPASVASRARVVADLVGGDASVSPAPPSWWGRYPFQADDVALELVVPIADLHAVVYALRDAAGTPVPVRGGAGAGVMHAALPARLSPTHVAGVLEAVRAVLRARGGSCRVLAAPARIREQVDLWGEVHGLDLLRRIKQRQDPDHRLAPGRFRGGL